MRGSLMDRVLDKSTQCGDCLLWKGGLACKGTVPTIYHEGKTANVRNALWRAMGKHIGRGCAIKTSCGEAMCVAPGHLVSKKYRKVPKSAAAKAKTALARRAISKLTEELVAEIRASDETLAVWAERTGVSFSSIGYARRQDTWRPLSDPFAGLKDRHERA